MYKHLLALTFALFLAGCDLLGPKVVYKIVSPDKTAAAYWQDKPCEIKELADAAKKEKITAKGGFATAKGQPDIRFCWVEVDDTIWTWIEGAMFPIPFDKKSFQ
jgi:hypothetical protein